MVVRPYIRIYPYRTVVRASLFQNTDSQEGMHAVVNGCQRDYGNSAPNALKNHFRSGVIRRFHDAFIDSLPLMRGGYAVLPAEATESVGQVGVRTHGANSLRSHFSVRNEKSL